MNKKISAMVFDFDGTLAELKIDFNLMKKRMAAMASALLEQQVDSFDIPVLEWLGNMRDSLLEKDRALALELHCRGRLLVTAMELDAARQGRLFEFTRPMFETLGGRGVKTAIITRNCTPAVRTVFPDLDDYCPVFLAREDVDKVKPHPEHLEKALDMMGADPAGTLMIGDHFIDIDTARRAGCLSCGVASGNLSQDELAAHGPDFVYNDCAGMMDCLEKEDLI